METQHDSPPLHSLHHREAAETFAIREVEDHRCGKAGGEESGAEMSIEADLGETYRAARDRLRGPTPQPVVKLPREFRDAGVTRTELNDLTDRLISLCVKLGVRLSTLEGNEAALTSKIASLEAALDDRRATALPAPLQWRKILIQVSKATGFTVAELCGMQRHKELVEARYAAMYRMSHETTMSLAAIGRRFNRDHTTVMHGIKRHEDRMKALRG